MQPVDTSNIRFGDKIRIQGRKLIFTVIFVKRSKRTGNKCVIKWINEHTGHIGEGFYSSDDTNSTRLENIIEIIDKELK